MRSLRIVAILFFPVATRSFQRCLSARASTANYSSLGSLLSLLHRCKEVDQLYQIHAQTVASGLVRDPFVASELVEFAAGFHLLESLNHAFLIADWIGNARTFTWNAVLRGYLKTSTPLKVILVYAHLRKRGIQVDSFTAQFLIRACVVSSRYCEGKMVHCHVLKMGFSSGLIIQTALLKLHGSFGDVQVARQLFDRMSYRDSVSWNAVIAVHVQKRQPLEALWLSCAMINENFRANEVAAVSILSACSNIANLKLGQMVHGYVVKNVVNMDVFVCNSLVDMYCKCGQLSTAHQLFDRMSEKTVVSWTALINGYTENGLFESALRLFWEMESQNIEPDQVAVLGILCTCAKSGYSLLAELIDDYVRRKKFGENTVIANALIDMHAKCGNLGKACQIFNRMRKRTLVSWTAMIKGLSIHGHGRAALTRFIQMQREGFRPDDVVFLSVLHGCSHAGLVDEGLQCFNSMVKEHGIAPGMDHYGCMVDLLCRAGLVAKAFEFVESMPFKPDSVVWRSLLGACKYHGNDALAGRIMSVILELEPTYSGNYVLLSNIYASNSQWENVLELREGMAVRGPINSNPGCSAIAV
ncbi:Pentatricopeptide repeat-containing protein [Nymphaea thermarum]|nr:Pentatricopeptide repeat-containing protein [Nymphaea thermarum]